MNRDEWIAHLSIHGWEPVREVPSAVTGYGLANHTEGWGLRVIGLGTPKEGLRKIDMNRIAPCEWSDITDAVFVLIAVAISTWVEA